MIWNQWNLLKTITPPDDSKAGMTKDGDPRAKTDIEVVRLQICGCAVGETRPMSGSAQAQNTRQRAPFRH